MELKQNTLEHIHSALTVTKAKELPAGEFEAILSTDDLDRHGEIVSIKGMQIPADQVFKIYYNHETTGANLPIGQWTKIWKSADGKLKGRGKIDLLDDFEIKIDKKIKLGTLDSISIGFYPQEFDGETGTWTKSTLVEASVVAEPANTKARVTSKALGFTEEEFKESLIKKLAENTDDHSGEDGAADTELKAAYEDLNSRLGAVEQTLKEAAAHPAKKNLVKVRLALKQVGQSADQANRIIKVKLKES